MANSASDTVPGGHTPLTNEQVWNMFWDEMCSDYWGKALNPYLPQGSIRKIMNKYEIKLKSNDNAAEGNDTKVY